MKKKARGENFSWAKLEAKRDWNENEETGVTIRGKERKVERKIEGRKKELFERRGMTNKK